MDKETAGKIIAKTEFAAKFTDIDGDRDRIDARWCSHGYYVQTEWGWELFWCKLTQRWYALDVSKASFTREEVLRCMVPQELVDAGLTYTPLHIDQFNDFVRIGYAALVRSRMKLYG